MALEVVCIEFFLPARLCVSAACHHNTEYILSGRSSFCCVWWAPFCDG